MNIFYSEDLQEFIGRYLHTTHQTISTAENTAVGFLQFSFSQIKGVSKFFKVE
ncbi:CinA family protein [Chryseobacterium ginsenosidimutans]|uniref:CinA family protein n=1 Tax=Chryseobacterium ginsenosidimutans TaxID=687846 RepID=UPI003CD05A80